MRTLVFDLDGTLVDSVPDLRASLNRLMGTHALAPFSAEEVKAMVGDGAAALVQRAFAARGRTQQACDLDGFLSDYRLHVADLTQPFDGVPETLRRLARDGWRMAVCTNKPEEPARALLEALGLLPLFAAVGGGDSFATKKPDPAHLLATLAAAGGTPERAVMVGDHHNDVLAARGAGVPCVFALWGYGAAGMAEGAAREAERIEQLPLIAGSLVR